MCGGPLWPLRGRSSNVEVTFTKILFKNIKLTFKITVNSHIAF